MTALAPVRAVIAGTLTLLVALASCSSSQADDRVVEVGPRRAVELLASGDYVVLDVRTTKAFRAGHVAKARHLPFAGRDFEDLVQELDPDLKYLVYSRNGAAADAAAELMVVSGIDHVVDAGAFGPLALAGAPLAGG